MSKEHDARRVYGYVVYDIEAFFAPLLVERKETSHAEPRFDRRTETRLTDEVVGEYAGLDIEFAGKRYFWMNAEPAVVTYDAVNDFCSVLSEALGCSVAVSGDITDDVFVLCIEPTGMEEYTLDEVIAKKDEVVRIGEALSGMGLDPGRAGVHSVLEVY